MWPKTDCLVLPRDYRQLSSATDKEYRSVQEDLLRWRQAREWKKAIQDRRNSKRQIWALLQREPEMYRQDMVSRMKVVLGGD